MKQIEEYKDGQEKLMDLPAGSLTTYNVGIVGAGSGCIAILEMVHGDVMKHFRMKITAVCDVNPDAPGMIAARKLGIHVTSDYRELFGLDGLNMIIELTGDKKARDEIYGEKPSGVEFIDHTAARLLWDLYEADLEKIETEVHAQQRIDEEKNRIKQIFNNLPDAILVIDPDMIIRDVNQTFLDSNNLEESEVTGKHCYEVENRLKGECQITDDYCPMHSVLETKTAKKSIYHHIDKQTGKDVYSSTTMSPLLDEKQNVIGVIETSRDISYRIKLEEELVQSKIRLEKFMEAAPFFIAIKNLAGQYIQINQRGCKDLGLSFQDVITKTDMEIFPPETAKDIRKHDQKVIKHKKDMISAEMIERDGVPRFYQTTRFPIFDHKNEVTATCMIAQDVTALRQTQMKLERKQRELQDTKEYLQSILENSPSIILTTDLEGNIVSFNHGAEEQTGYPRDRVIGKHASMLFRNPRQFEKLMKELDKTENISNQELELSTSEGGELQVDATISRLLDNAGAHIGTVAILHDITPRKIMQQQLIRTDRLVAIGKLGAGVAHEINNPTAVIGEAVGWARELIEGDTQIHKSNNYGEIVNTLDTIKKNSVRIADITHRLLGFASQSETTAEQVDINSLIREVIRFTIDIKKMNNIRVNKKLAPKLPLLNLNMIQLQQTFVNIIDNAVDAIGSDDGDITIETRRGDGSVIVEISDDGPGIAPDVLDRIFDPFVTTKPVGKGTGLGLSICYGIIQQMGGNIEVSSKPGKGTTFRIILPLKNTGEE